MDGEKFPYSGVIIADGYADGCILNGTVVCSERETRNGGKRFVITFDAVRLGII